MNKYENMNKYEEAFKQGFTKAASDAGLSNKVITRLVKRANPFAEIGDHVKKWYEDSQNAAVNSQDQATEKMINFSNNPITHGLTALNPFSSQVHGFKDYFTGLSKRYDNSEQVFNHMGLNNQVDQFKHRLDQGGRDAASPYLDKIKTQAPTAPFPVQQDILSRMNKITDGYNTEQSGIHNANVQHDQQQNKFNEGFGGIKIAPPGGLLEPPKPSQPITPTTPPSGNQPLRRPYF